MKFSKKLKKKNTAFTFNSEKLFLTVSQSKEQVYSFLNSRREGLYSAEAVNRLKEFGSNEIIVENKNKWFILLIKAFINPFIGILMVPFVFFIKGFYKRRLVRGIFVRPFGSCRAYP